jgi:hypothetical protein
VGHAKSAGRTRLDRNATSGPPARPDPRTHRSY